jgi:hypothetical protein
LLATTTGGITRTYGLFIFLVLRDRIKGGGGSSNLGQDGQKFAEKLQHQLQIPGVPLPDHLHLRQKRVKIFEAIFTLLFSLNAHI